MQYVRSVSSSLSQTWNSINPATLSGAIDVIVVEQEDGALACSPFHIRFGKFSLLRPSEKKVEFKVNGRRVDYPMKLGEGGEAFFVFETHGSVPEGLQTSPLVSPATSPAASPALKGAETQGVTAANGAHSVVPSLQEPEPFELEKTEDRSIRRDAAQRRQHSKSTTEAIPIPTSTRSGGHDSSGFLPDDALQDDPIKRPITSDFARLKPSLMPRLERTATDSALASAKGLFSTSFSSTEALPGSRPPSPLRMRTELSRSPPRPTEEARARAMNLSRKLWTSNISNQVTESGDLMLDMTGFKSSEGEALHAEIIARQLLSEEIDGPYDIGSLISADNKGNIWIYSSEEAKEAAARQSADNFSAFKTADAVSDPGYHSDEDARSESEVSLESTSHHLRHDSDSAVGMTSYPSSPTPSNSTPGVGDPNKNYAKTLRLTSQQLQTLDLKRGPNSMSFTVNRATCNATLWFWHHATPIVISDIDGTITKSDVLGHVLNAVGRDWTHQGVAKLYSEIAANGYNFLYLTSRSVGQADSTRAYLDGVVQDGGWRLPRGPVILSPDRTIAALRRELYLRKPEIFKMACLRDIMALFTGHGGANDRITESAEAGLHSHLSTNGTPTPDGLGSGKGKGGSPFYAGFGNRLTDALSYRSVNIPSARIFTINSNSEVSLDLLSLKKYKTAYSSMREIVDHYFPPVGLLVKGGGEEFTDFSYWRDKPLEIEDFTDSESEDEDDAALRSAGGAGAKDRILQRVETAATAASALKESILSEDEAATEDDMDDEMLDSMLSDPRLSLEGSLPEGDEGEELTSSMLEEDDGDDELDEEEEEDQVPPHPRTPETKEQSETLDSTPQAPKLPSKHNLGLSLSATDQDPELD